MSGFNHFPAIAEALDQGVTQAVSNTAGHLKDNTKAQISANEQYQTGFMHNSVYVRTSTTSTYGETGEPVEKGQKKFEEVEAPPDKHTAYMGVAAEYGEWQNYGTRKMAARPFLEPAVNTTRPQFDEELAKVDGALRLVK